MNDQNTQDKVYKILDIVSHSTELSQRDLATSSGLSLGMVNLLLKRLIETGHIKISNLNKKKVQYILTPKGAAEKAQRTYRYISRALQTFSVYSKKIEGLIQDLAQNNSQRFAICGDGEIASLVEMQLRHTTPQVQYRSLRDGETPAEGETVLDCRFNSGQGSLGISILAKLLETK